MSTRARGRQGDGGGDGGDGGGPPQAADAAPAPDFQQLLLNALQATNAALAGLGTTLTNLPADLAAAIPAPAVAPIAAPAAPPAAVRSPFRASGATVIDFHSKEGKKLYDQATRSLFANDELFKVEPERFQLFINRLNERARNLGMLSNGASAMIPPNAATPTVGTPINMITGHGQITLEQVRAWEATFIGTNSRHDQNSQILYDLIMNSLSAKGQQRV